MAASPSPGLILGSIYPKLRAVASYVGSGAVLSSPDSGEPAWTYRGKSLPHLPFTEDPSSITQEQIQRATIPVEEIDGPVLLIVAGDDAVAPSAHLSRIAMERLKRHNRSYQDELVVYPNAGHLIQAPYVPTAPNVARFGGEARANAEANEDSWQRVLRMLKERLKDGGG